MKRKLFFVFALLLSLRLNAQTTLTEAINFKSVAHDGEEIELFEILDNGQYVILDFFFSTCGPCKEYAPRIVEAYYRLGSNQKDVYIMEISPSDNNKPYSAPGWIEEFNIPYPTIHTKTGGDTGNLIYDWYKIEACPTLLLIAPDRKILLQDYKPKSAESFVEFLTTNYDIEAIPPGPDTLTTETLSTSSIKLTWSEVEGATSYNVYVNDSLASTVTGTTYTVEGLSYDTEYCFKVSAMIDSLETTKSTEVCKKTLGEGVEEFTSSFSIYPNPVQDELFLATEVRVEEVAIYDIYGRQQAVSYQPSAVSSIDVAGLDAGVYFINIKTDKENVIKRFIKN